MSQEHDELEMRIAYQDDAIDALSRQVYEQSRELTRLAERCRQLEAKVAQLLDKDAPSAADASPPHY